MAFLMGNQKTGQAKVYETKLEMVQDEKLILLEQQLKKCQDIAMALGIEHNEKMSQLKKAEEAINKAIQESERHDEHCDSATIMKILYKYKKEM